MPSINIAQLTAKTCLADWFQVTASSQRTTATVILELLEIRPMTCEELSVAGKFIGIGSYSHVNTTVAELRKRGKVRLLDKFRPYTYALISEA